MINKLFFLIAIALIVSSCNNNEKKESSNLSETEIFENTKVAVYYMHGKMRCVTCNELEKIAKETIEEEYSNNDDVKLYSIDFSLSENRDISDKYEVAFSSLLIATKDEHVNITMEAFEKVFAETDELKELIINEVNNYLNN